MDIDYEKHTLGILGGMGPLASYFKLIIEHTNADEDNQHIDVLISGRFQPR